MKEIHLLTLQLKKGIRRFSTIVNHLKDKNPAMNDSQTLLHIAHFAKLPNHQISYHCGISVKETNRYFLGLQYHATCVKILAG